MPEPLRIAQLAPLIEPVPPPKYGGTERVVADVTDALVEQGHEVTLFASGDSRTRARLVAGTDEALRKQDREDEALVRYLLMLEEAYGREDEFDIFHAHLDFMSFPFARRAATPTVTTLHGRLDLPMLPDVYDEYSDMPLVSISEAQRAPMPPEAGWAANIYHGIPLDRYRFRADPEGYLAFLGRISPEKRVDSAIRVALKTGRRLKIAAKVDRVDETYFEEEIEPMMDHPRVEFLGEIGESEKQAFLGEAAALLFMIDWPEPFGLAMIEAMACGTPVIARRRGSVPEVVDEGVTGFVCEDEQQARRAVHRLDELDRRRCRRTFEQRFGVRRMARQYVDTYRSLIEDRPSDAADWPFDTSWQPRP